MKSMWNAIMVEIKNSILRSWFHIIRFGGLLIIPFLYGFFYIFAFFDPFEHVDNLPVAVMTYKDDVLGEEDILGTAVANELGHSNAVRIGEMEMTIKADHIYYDNSNKDELVKQVSESNHATFVLPNLQNIFDPIIRTQMQNGPISGLQQIGAINQAISDLSTDKVQIINNFKMNYLIAFGIDISTSMSGTIDLISRTIINSLMSPSYIQHLRSENIIDGSNEGSYTSFIKGISDSLAQAFDNDFNIVKTESYMHEHAKYGYGLAPFFISVAMWIGAMVMTFAVHRKIYDTKATPTQRYFAKWLVIIAGIIVQATILMTSLYLIGFDAIGLDNWFSMYGFAIIFGIIFSGIIQAIRFSIWSRNIGILLTIMMLVLQMASGGGLFPIETQSSFYQVMNDILPIGHTVNIFRELAFDTNWSNVFKDFAWLSLWLILIPIGLYINHKRTIAYYIKNDIKLPPQLFVKGGAHD